MKLSQTVYKDINAGMVCLMPYVLCLMPYEALANGLQGPQRCNGVPYAICLMPYALCLMPSV